MIKLIKARYLGDYQVELHFSDGTEGILTAPTLLQRSGSLLEPLKEESYFQRLFIDAGALCWPNGLELSPSKLHTTCRMAEAV